jgi:uncharacterized membrane protein
MLRKLVIPLLAVAGMVVAGYLTYSHIICADLICFAGGGCNIVNRSPYAEIGVAGFHISIAMLGLGGYIIIFPLSLLRDRWTLARLGVFFCALFGFLYSAYLTYLELFVIHAICEWCVTSAVIMTCIFLLSIIDLREAM